MSLRTILSIIFLLFYWLILPGDSTASGIHEQLSWKRCYDDQGRIAKSIDPAGRITQYSYTTAANGNLHSVTMTPPEGSPVTWRFDVDGQLATMSDGEGEVAYRYDNAGRLTAIERVGDPAIRYSYDDANRIAELRVGDFYRIAWTYDFMGRIASIETPAGQILYEYQTGQGMVIRSLPNGVKTFWKRQPNGELEEITHGYFKKPGDETYTLLAKYTYAHGPDGRIAAIREQSGQSEFVRRYAYDAMGRLILGTGPGGQACSYSYDLVGNRIKATATDQPEQVCTYDWAGRLTSVDGESCSYDGCGNLTEVTLDGVTRQYRYHPDGRLAEVQVGGETVQYCYDGFGRLISRKTAADETRFIADPLSSFWQPLVMEEPDGRRTLVVWDGSAPLAIVSNGNVECLLGDHLSSVRLVTDSHGGVIRSSEYDPFGVPMDEERSATLAPRFAGLFWDEWVHGNLALARAYLPEIGIHPQPDLLKRLPSYKLIDDGLFSYCGEDPVNFYDVDGADARWVWGPENWAWQVMQNPLQLFDVPYAMDWWGNYIGRSSNWFGRNVTGGLHGVTQKDALGQLPLGDTRVSGNTWWDQIARMHDIEYYISAHPQQYPKGQEIAFEGPHGTEYFKPGSVAGANIRLLWRLGLHGIERRLFPEIHWPDIEGRHSPNQQRGAKSLLEPRNNYRRHDDYTFFPPPPGGGGGSLSPSPVGGVYLGGAGGMVEGLGALKGIHIDANNNLFLISEEQGDVKLPPLRIDDVVTVFRSVYLYGEGPTVTIDPNPENPEKSAMIIRHSEATEETYVGWVLYQADRLMKSYTQGMDNITQKDMVSRVPGYTDVVNTIYFGAGDPRASQKGGVWERFWIVPAEARRFEGARRELTLFDVPLKVKTQKMKWEKDKLVDDPNGKSSPGALAFTSWFTANYDSIAAEQYLTPPVESGITTPVPVFAELRRIALMTAIAEKLRDQNVPMPFWMYDYEVRKVPFEKFTPGLEVTWRRTNGDKIETAHIFGGVQLSAESKVVKTYATTSDVTNAPPIMQGELDRSIKLATNLERAVSDVVSPLAMVPLTVQQFETDNHEYQAVSVPGAETKELGPCRLDEIDIIVPVVGSNNIQLPRSYNSFFNPKGPWGQGWALDLPRLVEIRVPVDRDSGSSSYTFGYELLTPLNSLHARFLNEIPVLGFSNPRAPVLDQNSPFRNMSENQPAFFKDVTTRLLLLKNGQEWHFTLHGDLIAVKDGPEITAYERGTEGQVTRIVSLFGGQLAGDIKLEYAADWKLTKAVGTSFDSQQSQPIEVTYAYDDTDRLIGVTSDEGTVGYRYEGFWVSAVTWRGKGDGNQPEILRSFQYNPQGQILSEMVDSVTIIHSIARTPSGFIASSRMNHDNREGSDFETMVTQYDQHMRPTRVVAPDGDSTMWSYPATGGVEMTIKTPDQKTVKVIDSPDGNRRLIERNGIPWITAQFDDGERLANLSEFGRSVLTQEWRPDGQLASAQTATQGASLQYDGQGLLSSIVLHPARTTENTVEWQQTKLDRNGRPIEVTDYTGLRVQLNYDRSGAPVAVVQQTPDGNYGYHIKRDGQGRIDTVNSSWGNTVYAYDSTGNLQGIVTTRGDKSAAVELSEGRICAMTGFDNSRTSFEYYQDGPVAGMPQSILCPDGLKLDYEYDSNGRLSAVKVGTDRYVRLEYDPQGRMTTYAWESVKR